MHTRFVSLIARAVTAAGRNSSSSIRAGRVTEISEVSGVSGIFGVRRAVGIDSPAEQVVRRIGYDADPRDRRKYGRTSISQLCVERSLEEDLPAYGHSPARPKEAASEISRSRDRCRGESSPFKDTFSRPNGLDQFSLPSRIRMACHASNHHEDDGGSWITNDVLYSAKLNPSPILTKFQGETMGVLTDPFISSTYYLSTSLGGAPPYERVLYLNGCIRSRQYSAASERIPSVSERHGDDVSNTNGGARHGNDEGGEKGFIRMIIPDYLWPYAELARLDKPIGTWLLAWPTFWSVCLAAPSGSFPDPEILGWLGLGAIILRGAGCTVNDLLDRDIDRKVLRTQKRPLASGVLTPFQGLSFLGFQLLLGLGVLLQLNDFSKILGPFLLPLLGTYPLMKRWTFWPQAYLGFTFNWGALFGWAAVHGSLDLSAVLPLYASGVCWTIVYDTIYAHQDKEDDVKVGVKSTALLFGNHTQRWLTGFSTGCVTCLTLAGYNCGLGWPFYAGVVAAAGHLAWQVSTVDIDNPLDCNRKFVSNKWFGAIVCSSIFFGKLAEVPSLAGT